MEKSKSAKWFKPVFDLSETLNKSLPIRLPVNKRAKQSKEEKCISDSLNLIDRIQPSVVSELAVHTKKITEVENWLRENVLNSNKVSILLLTGPTGSGKTTTLNVLCKSLNIHVNEWINPVDIQDDESTFHPGQIATLVEFIIQSSRYPSLFTSANTKKVILLEDFPNAIIYDPTKLDDILQTLLSTGRAPVVFICTETAEYCTNLGNKLFPQTLREKFMIQTISFNPVNITLLKGALKRAGTIIQEKYSSIYQVPSQETVNSIINSSMGDIRSAINYYNFACLKGSAKLPNTVAVNVGKKRKRNESHKGKLSSMNCDESIGIFHGIGRVLYSKRIESGSTWKFEHSPELIINQFSSMPKLFVSFLYENYLRYFGNFDNVCNAVEMLSFAELLMSKWEDKEIMFEYGLWTAVLGLMLHNENVVHKWNPIQGPRSITQQKQNSFHFGELDAIDASYHNIINKFESNSRFKLNNFVV